MGRGKAGVSEHLLHQAIEAGDLAEVTAADRMLECTVNVILALQDIFDFRSC